MSDRRCFMLEPYAKKDVSDASMFGDLIYLFKTSEPRPSIYTVQYQDELARRFRELNFDPENDTFVLTGYTSAVCIAVAVLSKMYDEFDVLMYHSPSHAYTEVTIECLKVQ
jgi:hypothetical protein